MSFNQSARLIVAAHSWSKDTAGPFMANSRGRTGRASRRLTLIVLIACYIFVPSLPVSANTSFGIYDARTLAMGGVSVASTNNDNAQFYNAALLAFNDEIEERTRDSRFLFPLLIPQVAESAINVETLLQDDLSAALSRAVRDFNATPGTQSAQTVVDISANLDGALAELEGEDLFADIYLGFAVSEPGKFQGAGFFMGTRLLVGGQTNVSAADRSVLAAYEDGLLFIASGGAQGAPHPELFDSNGALVDPSNDFDSTTTATGMAITEAGFAMSEQIHLFGGPVAAGFSFKVQRFDTFEDTGQLVDDRIDIERNSGDAGNVNFDIGLVKAFGDRWRVGFAVKDIIQHNYVTSLGTTIRFRPRGRLGVAYQSDRLQIAADVDLTRNEPLGTESSTQEAALGAEWAIFSSVKMRAGYRFDIQGNRNGIASLGVGKLWKRFAADFAYAQGSDARAAALQFGIVF